MGQVVEIRWRYVAIATNSGETVIIPNGGSSRAASWCSRGEATSESRGGGKSNSACPTKRRRPGDRRRRGSARPRRDSQCRGPPATGRALPNFGESSYQYEVRYWLTDLGQDTWTDSQVRLHVAATLARTAWRFPIRIACWSGPDRRRPGVRELAARSPRWRASNCSAADRCRTAGAGGELADCPSSRMT